MCLKTVMTKREQEAFLKKIPGKMTCWKAVEEYRGLLRPIFSLLSGGYHAGVNIIPRRRQTVGMGNPSITGGAHFFRHRVDAVAMAKYYPMNRRVIRCLIAKKDIDVIGCSCMSGYDRPNALTIIAHRATFAKTARKVSQDDQPNDILPNLATNNKRDGTVI